jgi:CheY-like chemotaxis protein
MAHPSHADLQLLVVDDEEFSRSIVVRILRKLGAQRIRQAVDGLDGLTVLRCLGRVDCIFLDFNMPRANELQMLQRIRCGMTGVDRSTPVAMLTGHSDLKLVKTAMALDVNAFLSKPTSLDVIQHKLDRILTAADPEIQPSAVYRAVSLPTGITLSDGGDPQPESSRHFDDGYIPGPPGGRAWEPADSGQAAILSARKHGILLKLEQVPPNAQLASDLHGPDGEMLIPGGTRLTPRLLSLLYDLRVFDGCVAELLVEPIPATA